MFIVFNQEEWKCVLGLYIVYFKQCDIMIYMKQYLMCINDTFLSGFRPKKLDMPQTLWESGNFNDQNTLNLSKNVSFEVLCN